MTGSDVQVDGRRLYTLVSHQLLDLAKGGPVLQQVGRKSVAKAVRCEGVEPSGTGKSCDDTVDLTQGEVPEDPALPGFASALAPEGDDDAVVHGYYTILIALPIHPN